AIRARSSGAGGGAYARASWKAETLAVGCGSAAAASAWRALMAATCAGVACFGVVGVSPQKPRALMISAGVCGSASLLALGDGLAAAAACFGGLAGSCASAEASWKVAAAPDLARGAASADFTSADLVSEDLVSEDLVSEDLVAAVLTGVAGATSASSSSFDLPPNSDANRLF